MACAGNRESRGEVGPLGFGQAQRGLGHCWNPCAEIGQQALARSLAEWHGLEGGHDLVLGPGPQVGAQRGVGVDPPAGGDAGPDGGKGHLGQRVDEGDVVRKGQVLAKLEAGDLQCV